MLAKLAQYPTFQVFLTIALSMMAVSLAIPLLIRVLRRLHIGQQVRVDGPKRHIIEKQGTPTMGGVAVVGIAVAIFIIMVLLSWPSASANAEKIIR